MLLLASAQAEAVPASVKNKLLANHQRQNAGDNSQSLSDSIKLCKYFDDKVVLKRMKHRSFAVAKSNVNESSKVKSLKNLYERPARSIEYSNSNDINTFAGYDKAKTRRNISLDNSLVSNGNGESASLENISQATLATSHVKSSVQKDTSDKVYLHVNGEMRKFYYLYFFF